MSSRVLLTPAPRLGAASPAPAGGGAPAFYRPPRHGSLDGAGPTMPRERPTRPRPVLRGPLVLLAAAAVGAALAGGALLLADRLGGPPVGPGRTAGPSDAVPAAPAPAGATAPAPAPATAPGTATPRAVWRCPLHPDLPRDGPGVCPICGMTLAKDEGPPAPR